MVEKLLMLTDRERAAGEQPRMEGEREGGRIKRLNEGENVNIV